MNTSKDPWIIKKNESGYYLVRRTDIACFPFDERYHNNRNITQNFSSKGIAQFYCDVFNRLNYSYTNIIHLDNTIPPDLRSHYESNKTTTT